MQAPEPKREEEVDQLLLNGRLRDELEPFEDEAMAWFDRDSLPTEVENEYLSAMLAWERAPALPISKWFRPEMKLPPADQLADEELHMLLWETIRKLDRKRIVLEFTDHLADRQLYTLIRRDILPVPEKKIDARGNYLHWDCAGQANDPDVWLKYYASDEERQHYADEGHEVPARETPPYPRRDLPKHPL